MNPGLKGKYYYELDYSVRDLGASRSLCCLLKIVPCRRETKKSQLIY